MGMDKIGVINIESQIGAFDELRYNPHCWHVISIRSPGDKCVVDTVRQNALSFLPVSVDDVWEVSQTDDGLHHLASARDVEQVLAWAPGKSPLMVHCFAGVSRSSAFAYLIASARSTPQEAVKLLNPLIHRPNIHLVKLGAMLLNNREIVNVLTNYYMEIGL